MRDAASPPHSIEEALAAALALAAATEAELLPLTEAGGRVLREAIFARADVPAAPTSMMDGYALRGGGPARLRVVEESAAGAPSARVLREGEAAPISTGALLPEGADAVAPIEDSTRDGAEVLLSRVPTRGAFVRQRASDLRAGERLLAPGERLGPAAIALLGGEGRGQVSVARRPRVLILSMGRELRPFGVSLGPGELHDSNGPSLAEACREAGAEAVLGPLLGDDLESIADAIARADAELVLTSGGASVGPHDHLRGAIERAGGELLLWRVAMKPGKPLVLARRGACPIVGLPGNPVSALVSFLVFVRPMLQQMLGATSLHLPRLRLRLGGPMPKGGERTEFVRARLEIVDGELVAVPEPRQASSALLGLQRAGALLTLAPGDRPREAGAIVEAMMLAKLGS